MDATVFWADIMRWQRTDETGRLVRRLFQPWFLLTAAMMVVGATLHYGDKLPLLSAAAASSPVGLTTRQTVERILFLLPVMSAAFVFGGRAGLVTLTVSWALMFPRAVWGSGHTDHALPEVGGIMVVGALLVLAITQQRREVQAQTRMRQNLHYFVRQVLTAQEDERKRIARELHDETAQALLLTCQRLDGLTSQGRPRLPWRRLQGELQDLREVTVQTLADLRRLTQNLRPRILDDHGLAPALEWLADDLQDQYGIEAQVQVAEPLPEQAPETQLLLFRIAQEALHNVGRHSGATRACLSLRGYGDRVRMVVEDNGRGFRLTGGLSELANRGKLGLLGMHERARLLGGSLEVQTAPGKGTTIRVELPRALNVEALPGGR
jgi:signal transduction histidine kinase